MAGRLDCTKFIDVDSLSKPQQVSSRSFKVQKGHVVHNSDWCSNDVVLKVLADDYWTVTTTTTDSIQLGSDCNSG